MISFRKRILLAVPLTALLYFVGVMPVSAQEPAVTIVDHINDGRHMMVGPDELLNLLAPDDSSADKKRSSMRTVYRVQVFSDNKGERSRDEGEKKKRAVQRRFPEYPVSLGWDSPYWKVKVGIFSSNAEAAEAAEKIKKAFPAYSREVHVIRDRVRTTN